MALSSLLENNKMIDFSITQADTLVAGLNFQITAAVDNLVVFKKSIVIKEKTFALIEHFFCKKIS